MAIYDEKPSALEAVGNGSWLYRFNIQECDPARGGGERIRPMWQCDEVTVWEPLIANKITEAVIASVCPVTHEQKLVNEYNAAQLGMIGGSADSDEAREKIAAYRDFLMLRDLLKRQVDTDCAEYGIV